jgi:hypothetical protein
MGITRDGPTTEKFLRSMKHIKQIKEHFGFSQPNMEQGKKEKEHRIPREKPTIGEIVREREEEAVGFFWIMLFIIGFWTIFFILLDYFFGVK